MTSRAFLLLLVLLALPAAAATDKPIREARAAAEAWLVLYDAGDYPGAWEAMDSGSRRRPVEQWTQIWQGQRGQLGNLNARRFRKVAFEIQSIPFGKPPLEGYVLFEALYEKTGDRVLTEKVMVRRGDDGAWRVQNYTPLPFADS